MATNLTLTLTLILCLLLVHTSKGDFCQRAYRRCAFRLGFGKRLETVRMGQWAQRPFTARIRSKQFGQIIGVAHSNAIVPEFVFERRGYPVSYFGQPHYSDTHFKTVSMRGGKGSAIAHEPFVGRQYEFARYRCVRLFLTSYQVLNVRGHVKKTVHNVPASRNKCIVFRTI